MRNPISRLRSLLYALARLLGDVRAVEKGPEATIKRIGRRGAGMMTGRFLGRLFR
jgi:hypothetical protein